MIKHVLLCSSGASRGQGTRSAEEMGHEGEQSALAKPLATSRTDSPSCRLMPNLRTSRFRRQWLQLSCCLSCDHQASSCHFLCTMYVRSKRAPRSRVRTRARAQMQADKYKHKCKWTHSHGGTGTNGRCCVPACTHARAHKRVTDCCCRVIARARGGKRDPRRRDPRDRYAHGSAYTTTPITRMHTLIETHQRRFV